MGSIFFKLLLHYYGRGGSCLEESMHHYRHRVTRRTGTLPWVTNNYEVRNASCCLYHIRSRNTLSLTERPSLVARASPHLEDEPQAQSTVDFSINRDRITKKQKDCKTPIPPPSKKKHTFPPISNTSDLDLPPTPS